MSSLITKILAENLDMKPEGTPNVPRYPSPIGSLGQAKKHWINIRDNHFQVEADNLQKKLKRGISSDDKDVEMVSLAAAMIVDQVAQGYGVLEFSGSDRNWILSGASLKDSALERIASALSLRSSADDNTILQYINSARSLLTAFCANKSIVWIAWAIGPIKFLGDPGRRYIVDENRIIYDVKDRRILGVTQMVQGESYWTIPKNDVYPRRK